MIELPLPDNVGQSILLEHEDGSRHYYVVTDEIARARPDAPNKVLSFQRLEAKKDGRVQLRFCHFFADESEWVFVQHALYISPGEFEDVVAEASGRGWFDITGK
ncbi:MAG: hypothetical protein JW850_11485 [Thermoflexales bacterium]|nr:hypothetical protein [Thermoflexales bacterium]